MTQYTPVTLKSIIASVVALVRERLEGEQAVDVESFVEQYYAGVAAEDLHDRGAADLYGAALAHWNFARQRTTLTPKIRVYNPQLEQHGWQSTHTIVEVVIDDMPFLVDSIRMALNRKGLTTHLVIHPLMDLERDAGGQVSALHGRGDGTSRDVTEAIMHFEVDRQTETDVLEDILADTRAVCADVRAAVEDWAAMKERLAETLARINADPPPLPAGEVEEGRAFLAWIGDDNFTFLGYKDFTLGEVDGEPILEQAPGTGLGLLRGEPVPEAARKLTAIPAEVRRMASEPVLLVITKGNSRSTIHRPGYLDYIAVRQFDANGKVKGESRFFGLFTSVAYNRSVRQIPLLREKTYRMIARAGYSPSSHAGKAWVNIIETFPRDELFALREDELQDTVLGILHLQERQMMRLFVHPDRYRRFYSCIVYVPRERFNTEARVTFTEILAEVFGAEDIESQVLLSESVLARLHFLVRVPLGAMPEYDVREIEEALRQATRNWSDDLHDALLEHLGEEHAARLYRHYGKAFKSSYRESYSARIAVQDIEKMETLEEGVDTVAMSLYRPLEAAPDVLQFKLFRLGRPIPLSDALPMLENMGLKVNDERPNRIRRASGAPMWLHDFGMWHREPADFELDRVRAKFQDAFARVWAGEIEDDGFNRLVLRVGLAWREIVILRAYCKYLRQAGIAFSQEYMERTLAANPRLTEMLVALFHQRFDPAASNREAAEVRAIVAINEALDAVANLDEDRILRSFLGVILATLRTNYYQRDRRGELKPYVSFKFDPKRIQDLPEPRPMFEIFVYSPRVEGVHLRGGPVARGGLRWSDRREDFRTEVLGLVKAQMVKNAVIVPVGSKGGFVPKRLPGGGDREAIMAEGVACYQTFIRALLDITDNLVSGEVVPPVGVVRHDGDDPYLVVAADKGTAKFSDIANAIAIEYGFWLGDAFASGGSQGYDHKGMGITARGAWESVKRHFRELGLDTQREAFTVVGIGDMSGDVFGNGMLLSEHIKLVAAFNHMHIFLDPHPNPAQSHAERKRLFELPRSSWADYDEKLLSEGGGIFPRSLKSIALSPKARDVLQIDADRLAPNELIHAILQAPVDLLWNGGIGTYVKSDEEHHDAVGDRANDAVRVDGSELRCRVVGEGGNLGFTQLGRVQFAAKGGRVFTDAIDNAGGVDCSDHEVNIKVLLNAIEGEGDMTSKQRNALLADMTGEVSALVLRNNYLQTQAMSLAVAQAPLMLDVHMRVIRRLEREGGLDPAIEFLPDKEQFDERATAGRGLTAPELSVVLAYVKINLFQDLLASTIADDEVLTGELEQYFPTPLREQHRDRMSGHRLWREIICTEVANGLVNRTGMTFAFRLIEETGSDPADVARSYIIARDVFQMTSIWAEIEALDNQCSAQVQIGMLLEARKLLERAARWLLRNRPRPLDIAASIAYFRDGVARLAEVLPERVRDASDHRMAGLAERFSQPGVPPDLVKTVSGFDDMTAALDIVDVATSESLDVGEVAGVYFAVGAKLDLDWLRDQIVGLARDNRWQALARAALRDDLYAQQAAITADVLRSTEADGGASDRIDAWMQANSIAVATCGQVLADLKASGVADFTMLSVAMREIRSLRQSESAHHPAAEQAKPRPPARRKKAKGKAA